MNVTSPKRIFNEIKSKCSRPLISLGAIYLGNECCQFRVWSPFAEHVVVHFLTPKGKKVPLSRKNRGYHEGVFEGVKPGSLYYYILNNHKERPDPASRYQPEGVHGPSQVVDLRNFTWTDQNWQGLEQKDFVLYELHVGTFTPDGTFEAIIPHLEELRKLGITGIELMPIAQFPGTRNWGYDGVYPYAVQNSYGGPQSLQRLINACHQNGLAVILDVVYNHLGPEGNYLHDFAPYFTDRYCTPWGEALNFDGPDCDEVRRYFIENALYWITEFHVDGLRLDAIHSIKDFSAFPFLKELGETIHNLEKHLGRHIQIIAESDLNDARVIQKHAQGGHGLDAQWNDDFHHALHALLTGERGGYYQDFGSIRHLERAFRNGYVYTGQYSSYRRRRHGNLPQSCSANQFVVFAQNHDQIGNRPYGERLTTLISFSQLKLAASVVLLSPFIPLLFMGEEYGETAPFQYFTNHSDPKLGKAVKQGRQQEFTNNAHDCMVPDPQAKRTFLNSRLQRHLRKQGNHKILYQFYRHLLYIRRKLLKPMSPDQNIIIKCWEWEQLLLIGYQGDPNCDDIWIVFSFNNNPVTVLLPVLAGNWRKILDTSSPRWLGTGSTVPEKLESTGNIQITINPKTCVIFQRIQEGQKN